MHRSPRRIDPRSTFRSATRLSRVLARVSFVAAMLVASVPPASASAPPDLESLMRMFAEVGAVRADFVSEQSIALLETPLESAGVLYFEPPSTMVRSTHRPGTMKVVVDAGLAAIRDETGVRRLDLTRNEIARGLIENLMIVLRGDLFALRDRFDVAYTVEGDRWSLRIRPRARRVRALVDEIEFVGAGKTLVSMSTREANGDRTEVTFSDVALGVELSPAARTELFSLELEGATATPPMLRSGAP